MPEQQARTMSPETSDRIESILHRVKEPETLQSVSELQLVRKVSLSEASRRIVIHMDIENPRGGCFTCGIVTSAIRRSIERDLAEQFRADFPGFMIEFA
jgi:metal-sulfur cluster biosynthetic enzyme